MRALKTIRLRLRSLLRAGRVENELDAELRDHVERQIEQYRAAGLSPSDARDAALRDFGNVPLIQERCRDTRGLGPIQDLRRDVAYAIRSMRRAPEHTAVAALSLALGIGANTAIFGLVNVLLLRDLPVASPQELVELGSVSESGRGNFSYPLYERVRDHNKVLDGVLTMSTTTLQAALDDAATEPVGRFVSGNFFELLGLSPALGRLLSPQDDRPGGAAGAALAVIGHGLWQRGFGADPAVVGKTLKIDTVPFTIVGVLPRSFDGLIVGRPDDFFIPIASEPRLRRESWLDKRAFGWLALVGRLKPGTSREAAKADLDLVFSRFLEESAAGLGADARRGAKAPRLVLESARAGLSAPRREFSRPLLLLMGAVSFVLLIACANVVNLLLARGTARRREIGLRLSLGASRGRLVRQLLTESATLGIIGGAMGLALAAWGVRLVTALMAESDPAFSFDVAPDARVLLYTTVLSLGSALLAGVLPALRLSRTDIAPAVRADRATLEAGRAVTTWSRVLIAGQVALSLLLLTGATLLAASLRNLHAFDPGFDAQHVLKLHLNPGKAGLDGERRLTYFREVLERVRSAPAVRAAALSQMTPIGGASWDLSFGVEGRPSEPGATVYVNAVSDGYFATLGTRVMLGREFSPRDTPDSPAVAVINDAVSRRYFPAESPIGRRVRLGRQAVEVVGVVANAKYVSLREEDLPTVYLNALQSRAGALNLTVKTSASAASLAPAIRREVLALGLSVPVSQPQALSVQIDRSLAKERMMAGMLGAFALVALLLGAAGLYGVLGYMVARRTSEIGVRLALGATRGALLWSVLRESSLLVGAGVAIGVPAAVALSRLLTGLLFGVTPADPWVLGAGVSCLLLVGLAAAWVPAWRASRVDPLVALRYE